MPAEREPLGSGFEITLGGSSSILAHNLAALGTRIGFISAVRSDKMGEIALTRLGEVGVNLSNIKRIKGVVTGVTLVLPHGKRRHILTYRGAMAG